MIVPRVLIQTYWDMHSSVAAFKRDLFDRFGFGVHVLAESSEMRMLAKVARVVLESHGYDIAKPMLEDHIMFDVGLKFQLGNLVIREAEHREPGVLLRARAYRIPIDVVPGSWMPEGEQLVTERVPSTLIVRVSDEVQDAIKYLGGGS